MLAVRHACHGAGEHVALRDKPHPRVHTRDVFSRDFRLPEFVVLRTPTPSWRTRHSQPRRSHRQGAVPPPRRGLTLSGLSHPVARLDSLGRVDTRSRGGTRQLPRRRTPPRCRRSPRFQRRTSPRYPHPGAIPRVPFQARSGPNSSAAPSAGGVPGLSRRCSPLSTPSRWTATVVKFF